MEELRVSIDGGDTKVEEGHKENVSPELQWRVKDEGFKSLISWEFLGKFVWAQWKRVVGRR